MNNYELNDLYKFVFHFRVDTSRSIKVLVSGHVAWFDEWNDQEQALIYTIFPPNLSVPSKTLPLAVAAESTRFKASRRGQ